MLFCRRMIWLVLLSLMLTVCSGAISEFPEGVENEKYAVQLVHWERTGPDYADYKFVFISKNKKTGQMLNLTLQNETNNLKSLEIVKESLLIFGKIRGIADIVTILDLESGELRDSFICYGPQLSTTKTYIAYRKFYPRASEAPATSALILIYDLGLSAKTNRPASDKPGLDSAGFPIFPEENAHNHSLSVWVEAPSERNTIYPAVEYLWLNHDKKIVFVDKQGNNNWLVAVDWSRGLDQPVIKRRKIDLGGILELDRTSPSYENLVKQYNKDFMVDEIKTGVKGEAILHISSLGPFKNKELVMELP